MRPGRLIAAWIFQVLLAALFVLFGTGKFGDASWAERFGGWGYPAGFHLVVGAAEALGALALLVPRLATYAALALAAIMAGATGTHLLHGDPSSRLIAPGLFLALLLLLAWLRRPSAMRYSARA